MLPRVLRNTSLRGFCCRSVIGLHDQQHDQIHHCQDADDDADQDEAGLKLILPFKMINQPANAQREKQPGSQRDGLIARSKNAAPLRLNEGVAPFIKEILLQVFQHKAPADGSKDQEGADALRAGDKGHKIRTHEAEHARDVKPYYSFLHVLYAHQKKNSRQLNQKRKGNQRGNDPDQCIGQSHCFEQLCQEGIRYHQADKILRGTLDVEGYPRSYVGRAFVLMFQVYYPLLAAKYPH